MTSRELLVRAAALYMPMAIAATLWLLRRPDRRLATGAFLACAWNVPALFVVNRLAIAMGWWSFHVTGGLFAGVPVDFYVGWIVLWGLIPPLAFTAHPSVVVAASVLLDLVAMPACAPAIELHDRWLVGEAVAVVVALIPSVYFARWTATATHLARRGALQAMTFSGLLFFVVPAIALEQSAGGWEPLLQRSAWSVNLLVQVLAIPAVLGLSAVQEFASRGGGTPFPYDPPARLVVSGPYAYVANPMQLSTCLALFVWSVAVQSWWLAAGSVVAFAYGAGFAHWHEESELAHRFGAPWRAYRSRVRAWWPRWRPAITTPSRIYIAESCGVCSDVGRWLKRLDPVALEVVAAERFPTRDLWRMTYVGHDGREEEGVAALARALEHVNLAWAWLGMLLRLPGLRPVVQLIVDASGGAPRQCVRRIDPSPPASWLFREDA